MYWGGCLFEIAKFAVGFIVLGVLVHFFIVTIIPVSGDSMNPNIKAGDWVMLDKFSYLSGKPQRGDIVAVRFPGDPAHERYIKRIVGLPGEIVSVKDGSVYINDKKLYESYLSEGIKTAPDSSTSLIEDQYFLLGDNRQVSSDSRVWGTISKKEIIGKARMIFFPFNRYRPLNRPVY